MIRKYIISVILGVYCLFYIGVSYAGLSLPAIFGDSMVIQAGSNIPVWGKGKPGVKVTVSFAGQEKSAIADSNGKWMVYLEPVKPGLSGKMIVSADREITIDDIITGETWLCSGQSNMQWPLSKSNNADEEIANADYPQIRLFTVARKIAEKPQEDVEGCWKKCSPDSVKDFSAVGYFFGRNIHLTQKIPVGLISSNWDGSPAEAWTPIETLNSAEELSSIIDRWGKTYKDPGNKGFDMGWAGDGIDVSGWKEMKLPGYWEQRGLEIDGAVWFRRNIEIPGTWAGRELLLSLGKIADYDETFINGRKVGEVNPVKFRQKDALIEREYKIPGEIVKQGSNTIAVRVFNNFGMGGICGEKGRMSISPAGVQEYISLKGKWKYKTELELAPTYDKRQIDVPSGMFNAMISPLIPFAIRGVIWYQGENNASNAYQYRSLFPAMISSWRNLWKQGDFPFLFVQLANFMQRNFDHSPSEWAELREAQLMTLSLPETGMAVAIDIGEANDIHPRNKQEVGKRLALIARAKVYGENVVCSGPRYDSMEIREGKVLLKFKNTATGLVVKNNDELRGFSIAGKGGVFYWANAEIEGDNGMLVWNKKVKEPCYVRYGWADNPECNLYNKEGLPASPFRTDDLPGITFNSK